MSEGLTDGWWMSWTAADEFAEPPDADRLDWAPARVPGTVASALGPQAAGVDLDARDWWFRRSVEIEPASEGEELALFLDGLATVADVYIDGEHLLHSESMFARHRIDLSGRDGGGHELTICCRALGPRLAVRRRPRPRWRTALVSNGNLRFYRTMLLGRAPGFAPGPPVVGPWRPVRIERRPRRTGPELAIRPRMSGEDGVLGLSIRRRPSAQTGSVSALRLIARGPTGIHGADLGPDGGELRVPGVARWWPHTHGEPVLYEVEVESQDLGSVYAGRTGFRSLTWPADWEARGLALRINDVEVFCRGALWTPLDLTMPHQSQPALRAALETAVQAGMNMLRIPGIACYENDAFHDLCDELGLLVWQDFMLANLDYPDGDPAFVSALEHEVREELGRLAGRPSFAVACGGSEVAQQVTMLGLDPELARGPLYTELLPRLVEESAAEVPFVPNAPWGGGLPFRPDLGVANYYGVGAYLRPLTDARLAEVRFAAECLAFSNVPDDEPLAAIDAPGGLAPGHHPAWKAGVPRDAGAGWDFEDVRDHYLKLLYDEDPVGLRWSDVPRYLELSRAVTGEVMAEVFGEWRRAASPCAGGLVLWLRDLHPGAGWGLVDHTGRPKVALHHLRRALALVSVWISDEGLGGMVAHLANDRPVAVEAMLRVALYRDRERLVEQVQVPVSLAGHSNAEHNIEDLLGHFVDIGWTYRFGPPAQDLVVASFERDTENGTQLLSQAFRHPVGRPRNRETATQLGAEAELRRLHDGDHLLSVGARRLLHGVRIEAPGYVPADDAFSVEPGQVRHVRLTPTASGENQSEPAPAAAVLTALNLADRLRVSAA